MVMKLDEMKCGDRIIYNIIFVKFWQKIEMSPIYTKGVVGVHRCAVLCTRTLKKIVNYLWQYELIESY